MSVPTAYRGETDAKRVARFLLYDRINRLWQLSVRPRGVAIVLAGKKLGDLGGLRWVLKFNPQDVIIVDNKEKQALKEAEEQWPGVRTYDGDVLDVVKDIKEPIALANLDFTGYLDDHRERIVSHVGNHLSDGGVCSYTFFRGREHEGIKNWRELLTIPTSRPVVNGYKRSEEEVRSLALDEKRFIGYAKKLKWALGRNIHPVVLLRYSSNLEKQQDNTYPMGVLAFQRLNPSGVRKTWLHEVVKTNYIPRLSRRRRDEMREYLRICSIRLFYEGLRSNAIGAILNTKPTIVAAWLAHETRGTYADERR
jgi:hypothetical protein